MCLRVHYLLIIAEVVFNKNVYSSEEVQQLKKKIADMTKDAEKIKGTFDVFVLSSKLFSKLHLQ